MEIVKFKSGWYGVRKKVLFGLLGYVFSTRYPASNVWFPKTDQYLDYIEMPLAEAEKVLAYHTRPKTEPDMGRTLDEVYER